ncbi:hypothetical protein CYV26_06250 [Carnobacterium maltaromaticum]|uniref:hypothetical protein n=1 Tax=Carnobacterium maltaromaticum TaxID=2751 RepID=UPI000C781E97|nr:hypothetical protein [Carnobacterium maltaromaticum]PLS38307.1 hypothetical protein CYV33_03715 [Carnobacterium maltaromaticum]PLS38684.1 hypothetical protein CYV31_06240 [Carnobacterium maltaromaticum]PLS39061.1 hypothetical protein CYV30_03710 [Carnobacterium maltaromaticum]PLS45331.1 hypothetical protein CYV28_03710 [Carnobacterium maltaromaticum]PLS48186.1 hypothetical protein CYV27_01750 [Carnobacterium maltaromaticum]
MRNILMSCLVLVLFGCAKEVNLDNDKLTNSQKEIEVKEQIVDKEELDIKKIYGIWSSYEKKYSIELKEITDNGNISLKINDDDPQIIYFEFFDARYKAYTFLSENDSNRYRIVIVNDSQILFNYGTTDENSEGVTQMVELKKSN